MSDDKNTPITSEDALHRLLEGNQRYAAMRQLHPHQTIIDRESLLEGQHPFAAVLSCSDSRVPSELVFDQGLGDLFIVRTAGHVINELVLASLEYAVFALRVPLVMVVGHAQCGAVSAVMGMQTLPGHLPELVAALRPALEKADPQAEDALKQAIHANSRFAAAYLMAQSTVINEAVTAGRLKIAVGYYELHTGYVHLLE